MTFNKSGNAQVLCINSVPPTLTHLLYEKTKSVLCITKTDEPSN